MSRRTAAPATAGSSAWLCLRSAHVPAICIAVCLNCVNRPKLRISFGFNLELAACLLSRYSAGCLASLLSLSLPASVYALRYPFVSQYVYLNASHSKSSRVELRKWFRLACRATLSRYTRTRSRILASSCPIRDICDVAVTNWLHWLPPVRDPGPVL